MTDHVVKFLRQLPSARRQKAQLLIMRLTMGDTDGLDIRKLAGFSDFYRVRTGDMRVIFRRKDGVVIIIKIAFRGDRTYKNL